ncbi:hypothetical protein ACHAWF_006826 [Thalassiosira exigua]
MTFAIQSIKAHAPRLLASIAPRRSIVTHIAPTTSLLRSDTADNEVYLLGTAHVSEASTQEVVDLIRLVQPDVVFVELDSSRAAQLRNGDGTTNEHQQQAPFDISNILKHPFMSGGALSKAGLPNIENIIQAAPALLKRLGWFPRQGGEMKAALDEADRIGARCVYGDVEYSKTMSNLKREAGMILTSPSQWANIPTPPSEIRGVFEGLMRGQNDTQQVVESIKTRENAKQMTNYLKQSFPSIHHVMITNRDVYMAKMLRKHCLEGRVVACVGMAHVEGIEREWEELDTK